MQALQSVLFRHKACIVNCHASVLCTCISNLNMFSLSCRSEMDVFPAMRRSFHIPLDDCVFYSTLRRGFDVSLLHPSRSFSEAVCVWPHPTHKHIVFPISLPTAEELEQRFPEFGFGGIGLHAQWRLEKKRQDALDLTLELVRPLELAEFWALVSRPNINPSWMEACFSQVLGVKLKDVGSLPLLFSDSKDTIIDN